MEDKPIRQRAFIFDTDQYILAFKKGYKTSKYINVTKQEFDEERRKAGDNGAYYAHHYMMVDGIQREVAIEDYHPGKGNFRTCYCYIVL